MKTFIVNQYEAFSFVKLIFINAFNFKYYFEFQLFCKPLWGYSKLLIKY